MQDVLLYGQNYSWPRSWESYFQLKEKSVLKTMEFIFFN